MRLFTGDDIMRARNFARTKHQGQLDDDGISYFEAHILQVAAILHTIDAPAHVIMAALLHDTLEDTATTLEELTLEFGEEVSGLVHEMTHEGQKDQRGYYFPRLKSRDAIMIKLADRLSNISRMGSWPEERQAQYLKRTKFWKSE